MLSEILKDLDNRYPNTRALTIEQLAKEIGISPSFIRLYIRQGKLCGVHIKNKKRDTYIITKHQFALWQLRGAKI